MLALRDAPYVDVTPGRRFGDLMSFRARPLLGSVTPVSMKRVTDGAITGR